MPVSLDYPIPAREIDSDPNAVAEVFQQRARLSGPPLVDLEHEHASGREDVARGACDRLRLALVEQRLARLPVANLGLERVQLPGADVGRVRDDEVERAPRQPVVQIRSSELDVEPGQCRVLTRQRQRVVGGVDRRPRSRARNLVGERKCDRARPGADVEHPRRPARLRPQELDAALDDDLRLGPWHERTVIAAERQAAESPLAEHVASGSRDARRRTSGHTAASSTSGPSRELRA